MILDCTGIELTPGEMGIDCRGNGLTIHEDGKLLECCCEECDYLQCCLESHRKEGCLTFSDVKCPRSLVSSLVSE